MVLKAPLDPKRQANLNNPQVVEAICFVLETEGRVKICVWGKSMFPIIWPGAELWFKKCQVDDLFVGDIALVSTRSGLIAHRVEEIKEDQVFLRGDAYPCAKQKINSSELQGKLEGFVIGKRQFYCSQFANVIVNRCLRRVNHPIQFFRKTLVRARSLKFF